MLDYKLQFYVNYGVFSQGNSANKNLKLFGCCNMQTKFRNKCYLNKNLFFTISREIHNRGTWVQAHCCFLIFSYIPILFLEKNRIFGNIEISWAIDFAVFALWIDLRVLQILIEHHLILVRKLLLKLAVCLS
ncbi:hypothetical protein T12_2743 [Trichinella patagoniensis]|uniref:Uncharacterized protein n=1 Tax=Trichinella patagoniensis TaxID=990121 RepID=A0A0V0ZQ34_9BILA|nr:hypothetical protein T12_2743 [Trichinella patagoniensis]